MISLIVSTVDRTSELCRLLDSLEAQTYKAFEVIVVDQNSDERILPILAQHNRLSIRRLSSERGLSRGRNCGLSIARGEILATPDDDCWYPPDLLNKVQKWFAGNREFHGLLTAVQDESGRLQGSRRRSKLGCECDRNNIWHCGISFNAFLRRQVIEQVGGYDERLGVGATSIFQSGEETDYFLRALACGFRIWFEPELSVYHPSMREIGRMRRQVYPYALGTGFVLRKHGYTIHRVLTDFVLYSLGAAAISCFRLEFRVAQVRGLRVIGQIVGFLRAGRIVRPPAAY